MTPLPLTYAEGLDRIAKTDCCKKSGKIVFAPGCHPISPAWVEYVRGEIVLRCTMCNRPFKRIAVARIAERTCATKGE